MHEPRRASRCLRQWQRWAAVVAVVFTLLPGAHAKAADILWGINGHPFSAYPGISFEQQLDLVRDLGVTSYRVNVSNLAQTRALADLVKAARERNLQILPVLTPSVDLARQSPDSLYAAAFNLAASLAARFKADIRVWELGNELETFAILQPCELRDDGTVYPCSSGPAAGMTPLDYVGARWRKVSAVLKGLSDGIVSADPSLRKAVGTAGWGHRGAFGRLRSDDIAWDITVWHAYRDEPDETFDFLARFGKPIWLTEFDHPQGSTEGLQRQAEGITTIMRSLQRRAAHYRIEAAFAYELLDEPYWESSFEAVMGLVEQRKTASGWTPSTRKPAFDAVRTIVTGEQDETVAPCALDGSEAAEVKTATKVAYLYCLVLGRHVDGQGLRDWTARLERDLDVDELAAVLLASDEFASLFASSRMSDREFIRRTLARFAIPCRETGDVTAIADELPNSLKARRAFLARLFDRPQFRAREASLFAH